MLSGAESTPSEEDRFKYLIPSSLTCPIEMNGKLMQFPVRLFCCSYVCEKKSLQTWIDKNKQEDSNQEPTCPFCKTELKHIKIKDKLIDPYLPAREIIRNIEEFKSLTLPKLMESEKLKYENQHLKNQLRTQIPDRNKIILLQKLQVARLMFQAWLFRKIKNEMKPIADDSKKLRSGLKNLKFEFEKNSEKTILQILSQQKKLTALKNIALAEEEQIIQELQQLLEKRKVELQDYRDKLHDIKNIRYKQINQGLEIFERKIKRLQDSNAKTTLASIYLKKHHLRMGRYLEHQAQDFQSYKNNLYYKFGGLKLNATQQKNIDLILLEAIKTFNINQIMLCLKKGADLDLKTTGGSSGLVIALKQLDKQSSDSKNIEIIRILLNAGANTNLISPIFLNDRDFIHLTPLIYIISFMPRTDLQIKLELIDLLIKHQADMNAKDGRGETALSWAVGYADVNIVSKLLVLGAKIEDLDRPVIGGKIEKKEKGVGAGDLASRVAQIESLLKSQVNHARHLKEKQLGYF